MFSDTWVRFLVWGSYSGSDAKVELPGRIYMSGKCETKWPSRCKNLVNGMKWCIADGCSRTAHRCEFTLFSRG